MPSDGHRMGRLRGGISQDRGTAGTAQRCGRIISAVPSEEDKEKAAMLKQEVVALRARRNDPATPRIERQILKLKIETNIWLGQRLDPAQFKTYRHRSS
jgi:hypothetical protein